MQPMIGAWSDNFQSRFGRRRPFLVVGTVCVCVSIALAGWARDISHLLSGKDVQLPLLPSLTLCLFLHRTLDWPLLSL